MGMQSLALDTISALITWPNHPQPQASAHKRWMTSGAQEKQPAFKVHNVFRGKK